MSIKTSVALLHVLLVVRIRVTVHATIPERSYAERAAASTASSAVIS